jgi:hypothetical protein
LKAEAAGYSAASLADLSRGMGVGKALLSGAVEHALAQQDKSGGVANSCSMILLGL